MWPDTFWQVKGGGIFKRPRLDLQDFQPGVTLILDGDSVKWADLSKRKGSRKKTNVGLQKRVSQQVEHLFDEQLEFLSKLVSFKSLVGQEGRGLNCYEILITIRRLK